MAGYQNRMGYSGEDVDVILEDYNTKSRPKNFSNLSAGWGNYDGSGSKTISELEFTLSTYSRYSFIGTIIQFADWTPTTPKTVNVEIISQTTPVSGTTQLSGFFYNGSSMYIFLLEGTILNDTFTATSVTVSEQ